MKKFLIIMFAVIIGLSGCVADRRLNKTSGSFAAPDAYLVCPNGDSMCLTLVPYDDAGVSSFFVAVCNSDKEHTQTYRTKDFFRTRDTLLATWDDNSPRFWVYSADIGTFFWDYTETGWVKHEYNGSTDKDSVPKSLKDARPQIF